MSNDNPHGKDVGCGGYMGPSKREWTDAEVEWAARCLFDLEGENITIYEHSRQITLRALQGGYVPPPRPKSVREQVREALDCAAAWMGATFYGGPHTAQKAWQDIFLDALLARFDVKPKGSA